MPLPAAKKISIWPADEGAVLFAQKLSQSGRFEVNSPASISGILANQKISADLKTLTAQEQASAFATVCRETQSDMIFDWHNLGSRGNENFLSLSRANVTYDSELVAFACKQRSIVWTEQIIIVVELGGNSPPSSREINQAAAEATADRVIQAVDLGAQEPTASLH